MKARRGISDKAFWEKSEVQQRALARKNCRHCHGVGTAWVVTCYTHDNCEERDLVRCICTKPKEAR